MSRIVPQQNNVKRNLPKWLNPVEIINKGKDFLNKVSGITKQSSTSKDIVVSYACGNCNKRFQASNPAFVKQASIAAKENKTAELTCPRCGSNVVADKVIKPKSHVASLQSIHEEKKVNLTKEASVSGTYNTYLDRRFVYAALEAMKSFASRNGMAMANASYVKASRVKEAGADVATLNKIECALSWNYGRNQKGFATATINIDSSGRFIYPTVFKVASGKEYPFEERYVRQVEKIKEAFMTPPSRKKSDIPQYRPHDPSRFRVGSKKIGEYQEEKKTESSLKIKDYLNN